MSRSPASRQNDESAKAEAEAAAAQAELDARITEVAGVLEISEDDVRLAISEADAEGVDAGDALDRILEAFAAETEAQAEVDAKIAAAEAELAALEAGGGEPPTVAPTDADGNAIGGGPDLLTPEAQALIDAGVNFDVKFSAEGHKSSETVPTPAANPEELAEGEEITGERTDDLGDRYFVTSFGRKVVVREDGSAEQLAGPGTAPTHDNPAPQPGTDEHARAYGD